MKPVIDDEGMFFEKCFLIKIAPGMGMRVRKVRTNAASMMEKWTDTLGRTSNCI